MNDLKTGYFIWIACGICLFFGLIVVGLNQENDSDVWRRGESFFHIPATLAATPDPLGGRIILEIPAAENKVVTEDSWAVVQWYDRSGSAHDVEGWQSPLNYKPHSDSWRKTWWVTDPNYGEKSFRWAVYADKSKSKLIVSSQRFDLPQNEFQTVFVALEYVSK